MMLVTAASFPQWEMIAVNIYTLMQAARAIPNTVAGVPHPEMGQALQSIV